MVERGYGLVYGGGNIGLMGVLADAVLQAGGEAIGVIPQSLVERELAHQRLTELRIVHTMHERKAEMAQLADGFVALPGGFGTGDELFEMLTWAQLRIHNKPIGLLNVDGFFDFLLQWLDHMVAKDFLKSKHRDLLFSSDNGEQLLEWMNRQMR
jgi:uncharacterized protein (TIGR00730 family)